MMVRKPGRGAPTTLPMMHAHAAGLDVGATFHVIAVAPDRADEPVRTFRSFTADLHAMAEWLQAVGVTTIAMESTGVYWIPVYEILEARGFEVLLVNARDVKHVPGRKTDVIDAQWLQQLHAFGLLRGSFRPQERVIRLRTLLRHREGIVADAATHIQRMQKAMMQMNVQLHHVVTDITGATGLRIIRDIVAGGHDPSQLAQHRDVRCKQSLATIQQALTGHYQPEHLFALRQTLAFYDFLQTQLGECDHELAAVLAALNADREPPATALEKVRRTKGRNEPAFDVRRALYVLLGTDLTRIHAFGPHMILRIISECGTDMLRWPTVKHFTSWLTLAPGNKISGGRVLSAKTRRSSNRVAALLRIAAVSIGRTQTALGAFYRRLGARIGKAKAVTATARKLAVERDGSLIGWLFLPAAQLDQKIRCAWRHACEKCFGVITRPRPQSGHKDSRSALAAQRFRSQSPIPPQIRGRKSYGLKFPDSYPLAKRILRQAPEPTRKFYLSTRWQAATRIGLRPG